MKFGAFSVAPYERQAMESFKEKYNLDIDIFEHQMDEYDIDLSIYDAITTISIAAIRNETIDRLTHCKLIALRSIGFQYIDVEYCKKKGITVTNASYDPYNVADFTIMLMLMTLRKAKISICRALVNDFSLDGMKGAELRSQKIGILGTGKIGSTVIRELSGFGAELYCYDLYKNEKVLPYAEYKDLDYILENCDIISLHMPLTKDNYHIINAESIQKMKPGVILINTARGGLMDTNALIDGIESMHIGSLAMDTIEGEDGVAHIDVGAEVKGLAAKKNIMYLKQFPNVILTQHYGFFTEEACTSMVRCAMENLIKVITMDEFEHKVN